MPPVEFEDSIDEIRNLSLVGSSDQWEISFHSAVSGLSGAFIFTLIVIPKEARAWGERSRY
jgi:hypothetical protein